MRVSVFLLQSLSLAKNLFNLSFLRHDDEPISFRWFNIEKSCANRACDFEFNETHSSPKKGQLASEKNGGD